VNSGNGKEKLVETMRSVWLASAKKNAGMIMLFGVVEVVLGVLSLAAPAIAGGAITVMIGFVLLFGGIARLFGAFLADSFGSGALTFVWGLILAATGFHFLVHPVLGLATLGLVSIVLAVMIAKDFPLSGIWAVGTLVGINLLFSGVTMISVASAAKKV
jgi:uncharacterized membrane protein HdeD (DUF308 family)